jgi:hypothetical protein
MRTPSVVLFTLLFIVAASGIAFSFDPTSLTGIVTNTTNPKIPIISTATLSLDGDGNCAIRIMAPLVGSGSCSVTKLDKLSGALTVESWGPSGQIDWVGTVSESGFSGNYTVIYPDYPQLPEVGTFSFNFDAEPVKITVKDVLERTDFEVDGKPYFSLSDRSAASIYDKDGKYIGVRLVLDKDANPVIRIDDHKEGSSFVDLKTKKEIVQWHSTGTAGYFSRTDGEITSYFDRFMKPLKWSSIIVAGKTVYMYEENADSVALYDADFKPLNIVSGKTTTGKLFWTKRYDDGVTEYFDDSFKSLNWYSLTQNGQLLYAHGSGKKFKFFDTNMKPIRQKPGFWSNFGRGLALGLAAYGQALQAQAAAQNGYATQPAPESDSYSGSSQQVGGFGYTNTRTSSGTSYNTTTQRIGAFTYSNTTGSDGSYANTTRQQIGNFDYLNGSTNAGAVSGTSQRIGSFNYSNVMTPSGQLNATSQQIGNFTYHTITDSNGHVHTGTSQRIGDFIYTNIY